MLSVYLFVLWLLYTVVWRSIKSVRKSGFAFVLWFLLTAVMLWPLTRRGIEFYRTSPAIQATVKEAEAELDAELRAEFPEFYATEQPGDDQQEDAEESSEQTP